MHMHFFVHVYLCVQENHKSNFIFINYLQESSIIEKQHLIFLFTVYSDQERGNDYGPLRPHHHYIQWAFSV